MQRNICATAILVALGLAAPAAAQPASGLIGAFNPQTIVNQPIDTSNVVTPTPTFQLPTQKTTFNLLNIFRQIRVPSLPALLGQSTPPAPSTLASPPDLAFKPMPLKTVTPYEPRYVPTNNRYRRHRQYQERIH